MDSSRRAGLLTRLVARDHDGQGSTLDTVCAMSAEVAVVTGASITLIGGQDDQLGAGASDQTSARLETLQFTLGEGPVLDAHQQGRPILAADLAHPDETRWPAMRSEALEAGAAAIFAFPLRVGGARLGALDLYRDRPGPLTAAQHADAAEMAHIAIRTVLALQLDAPPGALDLDRGLRYLVHQAAGILSVQLDTTVTATLDRIRAHAFTHHMPIDQVAADIADHTLHIDR